MKPKSHRRLPKAKREGIIHAMGVKPVLLRHRIATRARPPGAVTAGELERDVLAFIARQYDGRHLDIEVAQLGLSNPAHQFVVLRIRSVV
jgi:hypothetical protein